jgi:hypothetical protein
LTTDDVFREEAGAAARTLAILPQSARLQANRISGTHTLDIALHRQRRRSPLRRMECESAVGAAFAVVMLDVGTKDVFEVAAADDQAPVETFGSDGADEPVGAENSDEPCWLSLVR